MSKAKVTSQAKVETIECPFCETGELPSRVQRGDLDELLSFHWVENGEDKYFHHIPKDYKKTLMIIADLFKMMASK